jgi:hypothetical protein
VGGGMSLRRWGVGRNGKLRARPNLQVGATADVGLTAGRHCLLNRGVRKQVRHSRDRWRLI